MDDMEGLRSIMHVFVELTEVIVDIGYIDGLRA